MSDRNGIWAALGRCWRGPLAVGLVLALLGGTLPAAGFTLTPTTFRVSLDRDGFQAFDSSKAPSMSPDGRFVAFESDADNLLVFPRDTNGFTDIYVRDRVAATTDRVSVGFGAGLGGEPNAPSFSPSISADGRFVAFHSFASNLVPSEANGIGHVFVRDRQTGTTERVSVDRFGGISANGSSLNPRISADGRFVAFVSTADNLVAGDTNSHSDVFVRDRVSGTTERVSVASDGSEGNGSSTGVASISADGRYVAFPSDASNLVAGDTNGRRDVFVRDRLSGTTERISVSSDETQANANSGNPSISGDGRYVAFSSSATNLVGNADTNAVTDIFVRDRVAGTTERASVASDGHQQNNESSFALAISADGRHVAFHSTASNLVAGDTNSGPDIFVHDRVTGATERVSLAADGSQANGGDRPEAVSISADGRYVAFASDATNLVASDTNGATDVFVRDRATGFDASGFAVPRLSVSDVQVKEGGSAAAGTLIFTISLSAASSQDVSFRFWTEDVTARDGSDYRGTFGTKTISHGATSTTISVPVFGDSLFEPDQTLHLNIDVPVNATIVDGVGVGTILNDDKLGSVGTLDLEPAKATVAFGERVSYQFAWTVPKKESWHTLQSLELRAGEEGSLVWVKFDEASGTLSLFDPASGQFGPGSLPGSHHQLKSGLATLYLDDSKVEASGPTSPTVTLVLSLAFEPGAAGQSYPVEVRATNDDGQVQGFDHAATLIVVPRNH